MHLLAHLATVIAMTLLPYIVLLNVLSCVRVCVCAGSGEPCCWPSLKHFWTLTLTSPGEPVQLSTACILPHPVSGPSPSVCSAPQTTVWQGKAESWSIVWCEHTVFFCSTSLLINTFVVFGRVTTTCMHALILSHSFKIHQMSLPCLHR